MDKKKINIAVIVDMSKSFVDPDGTFYCGAKEGTLENAAAIAKMSDLAIFTTDVHPWDANEFLESPAKGIAKYPAHNLIRFSNADLAKLRGYDGKSLEGKNASPLLTQAIRDALRGRVSGIVTPEEVLYQDRTNAKARSFSRYDVEVTFNFHNTYIMKEISPQEFLERDYGFIIAPKNKFDATALESSLFMPQSNNNFNGNFNIFTLIKEKYYNNGYEINFIVPGVVENICIRETSAGLRQMFPCSRIIVPEDAITPLYGVGLGFEEAMNVKDSCKALGKDIGIEYMLTRHILEELK